VDSEATAVLDYGRGKVRQPRISKLAWLALFAALLSMPCLSPYVLRPRALAALIGCPLGIAGFLRLVAPPAVGLLLGALALMRCRFSKGRLLHEGVAFLAVLVSAFCLFAALLVIGIASGIGPKD